MQNFGGAKPKQHKTSLRKDNKPNYNDSSQQPENNCRRFPSSLEPERPKTNTTKKKQSQCNKNIATKNDIGHKESSANSSSESRKIRRNHNLSKDPQTSSHVKVSTSQLQENQPLVQQSRMTSFFPAPNNKSCYITSRYVSVQNQRIVQIPTNTLYNVDLNSFPHFNPKLVQHSLNSDYQRLHNVRLSLLEKHNKQMKIKEKEIAHSNDDKEILKIHLSMLDKKKSTCIEQMESILQRVKMDPTQLNLVQDEFNKNNSALMEKRWLSAYRNDILQALESSQVLIISGEMGYGKSTLIPLYASEICSKIGSIASCQLHHVSVITLAESVADLIGTEVGKTVGYNLGKDNFFLSSNTNILFTTYHLLLRETLNSPFLSHYSCIILDDCHDRSVEADIFLCKAKEILKQRPNFKLILVSSHPEDRFETFFTNGEKTTVISLPNISFPVNVFWNTLRNPNLYVERAVDLITSIHHNKKRGNVVVFLPTMQETQKACALAEERLLGEEVLYFSLHNKTSIDEISEMLSLDTKRKVIFCTKCAESINLHDVRFVIESGKVKEKIYSTDKYESVISTHFISKETAMRRRQLAGHFKGGGCYCLYTENIYLTEMPEKSLPLISKLNPANLVLSLLYYKVDNPFNVNFICPLERKVFETGALELEKYGAVKDKTLTKLGKTMATMPFELRHAKLITLGMENGCTSETIVIALLADLHTPIFNTAGMSKDIGKHRFFDSDGDYFAIFNVYLEWKRQNFSKKWCQENGINHCSLISLHNKLTETFAILNIDACHPYSVTSRKKLIELICNCFYENLCVYTGHFRLGYKQLKTGNFLRIHSSSTFCYRSDTPPQYIVYDCAIDHDNFGFMINITPVPIEIIETILKNCDTVIDHKAGLDDKMDCIAIESVGEMFIKQEMLGKQGKKLKGLEATIKKKVGCESIIIDPNAENGRIEIYAPAQYLKPAKDMLMKNLEVHLEKLKDQEEETCIPTGNVLMKLSWGQGGIITKVSETVSKQSFPEKISNQHESVCSILHNYSINLTWRRRSCKGIGFVTFNSDEDFNRAFSFLSLRELSIHGKNIKVSASRKAPNQLYVEDLLPETSNEDLKEAIENCIEFKVKIATVVYSPPFSTTQESIEIMKETLVLQYVRYLECGNLDIHIEVPNSTDFFMKAYLNFDNYADIPAILNAVKRDGINKFQDTPLSYKPVYRTTIICVPEHYQSVKGIVEAEISNFKHTGKCNFSESVASNGIQLKLLTNDYGVMQMCEKIIMASLEGQKLEGFSINQLRKLFSHSGQQWLKQVEKATQCYIVKNCKQKTLSVCGTSESYRKIMCKIKEYLNNMESEIVSVIKIGEKNFSRQLIKTLVTKYDIKLEKFITECGLISVEFNVQYGQLILYGTPDSIKNAEKVLKFLASQSQTPLLTNENEELCPVCLTAPSTGSSHRLEYCGHLYCFDCLRLLVAEKSIPLKCCKEGCQKEFVVEDILDALEGNEEETHKLLRHSLNVYVEKNYSHVKFCPTPDCKMIYDLRSLSSVENSDLWTCPACTKVICTRCNILEHPGISCDMAKKMKEDSDYSLKAWMAKSQESRKRCPNCKSPIEKAGGCNHMTCSKCHAHSCWLCLQVFRDSCSVYNHLPYCSKNQTPYT